MTRGGETHTPAVGGCRLPAAVPRTTTAGGGSVRPHVTTWTECPGLPWPSG
jgi:hypothetical protein